MKTKYLMAGVVIGTVLLISNNGNKSITPLEKKVQITQPTQIDNTTNPYSPPKRNPTDYDPILDMKAILQPEDKIYDERKEIIS